MFLSQTFKNKLTVKIFPFIVSLRIYSLPVLEPVRKKTPVPYKIHIYPKSVTKERTAYGYQF